MCWYCPSPITEAEPIGRSARCGGCGKDIRSCRNCRFFLLGARGDCGESQAEYVGDKERATFCDWFSLNPKLRDRDAGETPSQNAASQARAAFDDLFR